MSKGSSSVPPQPVLYKKHPPYGLIISGVVAVGLIVALLLTLGDDGDSAEMGSPTLWGADASPIAAAPDGADAPSAAEVTPAGAAATQVPATTATADASAVAPVAVVSDVAGVAGAAAVPPAAALSPGQPATEAGAAPLPAPARVVFDERGALPAPGKVALAPPVAPVPAPVPPASAPEPSAAAPEAPTAAPEAPGAALEPPAPAPADSEASEAAPAPAGSSETPRPAPTSGKAALAEAEAVPRPTKAPPAPRAKRAANPQTPAEWYREGRRLHKVNAIHALYAYRRAARGGYAAAYRQIGTLELARGNRSAARSALQRYRSLRPDAADGDAIDRLLGTL